ncbi:RNA-binding protein 4.1-like [Brachionichthys hirsutus]|uniref:RNA-binding protein 4.1-like n=1 Tax=Brachionichthys hirsutus TaxID=412623 RepID=UPI0036053D4A
MVKIFIGNLSQHTGKDEVEALFTAYGAVTECAKYKNYAFVHMEDRKAATKAIKELHLFKLNGRPINVEPSRGRGSYQGPVKIHIANIERGFEKELREMFEEYGTVTECAIIKNFAFVHMLNSDEAMDAIQGLDNFEFQGKRIHVQVSKRRPRGGPVDEDFTPPPDRGGYYPPRYPMEQTEPLYGGGMPAYPSLPPMPAPPGQASYPGCGYGEQEGYSVVDYYERFRAHQESTAAYSDNRAGAIAPPGSALYGEHLGVGSDPYNRCPVPPPPQPSVVKDRSPIRRAPPAPAAATSTGNGYSYEQSQLSSLSSTPMYTAPRPADSLSQQPPPPATTPYTGY